MGRDRQALRHREMSDADRAAEREQCARVADDRAAFWAAAIGVSKTIQEARAKEARLIAAAIRARGET
jgi:hypothetical protein